MLLVVGGTGYTGGYLVESLLQTGESVRCLVRSSSQTASLESLGVELVTGDLEEPDGLADAFDGVNALISAAHIKYASALIRESKKRDLKRAVFMSSTWRLSEFVTPEVESVIAGEEAVLASGLDATLLRSSMIYGPGDDRNISRLRSYLKSRRVLPIFGSGEGLVQPVYVKDVVSAITAVIGRSGTIDKTYQLAGAKAMSYSEMIDTLCRKIGRSVLKVYIPFFAAIPLVQVYGMISKHAKVDVDQVRRMREDRAFDISEAIADFAFQPSTFEEGLAESMRLNGE